MIGGMHGYGGMGWGGWPGMLLGLIISLGLIVGLVLLIVSLVKRGEHSSRDMASPDGISGRSASPRDILQARYARGEINRDQYQEILADLSE